MPEDLKALLVVLGIAAPVLVIAKPLCLRFMAPEDFARRRNAWVLLTSVAFMAPNFWIYVAIAAPYILWLGTKDRNPVAVYLLLAHVIPPYQMEIPVVGINALFDLTNYRLLALTVFLPWLWRNSATREQGLTLIGFFLLLYGAVKLLPMFPFETVTSTVRRGLLFYLDTAILYTATRRASDSREKIVETLAVFCLVCAMFAVHGAFESVKTWALYAGVGGKWGVNTADTYLMRSGALRSSVSTGHALGLGYFTGIGFGFWLYLSSTISSRWIRVIGYGWMWAGLIAAYSRAPWLMTVLLLFCYLLMSPGGTTRFMKALCIGALVSVAVLVSPVGDKVIDNMPFIGTMESENVYYRQQLAEATWRLLKQNPLFGDPFVYLQMDDMKNGQGIIDLVNAYAAIALFHGAVGLVAYIGFQSVAFFRALAAARRVRGTDPDLALLGACLLACTLATVFFEITSGFMWMQFVFVGLLMAYVKLVPSPHMSLYAPSARMA
jgi:hypothetical protein